MDQLATIGSGPSDHASISKAAAVDPRKVFEFGKLAPELRNMIYGLCLAAERPIRINNHVKQDYPSKDNEYRIRHHRQNRTNHSVKVDIFYLTASTSAKVGNRQRRVRFGDIHTVSLLRLNRQISREAGSVLYSHNCFAFASLAAFKIFATQVSTQLRFLTNVEVSLLGCSPSTYSILRPLRFATSLTRLQIKLHCSPNSLDKTSTEVWGALRRMVQGLAGRKRPCTQCIQSCVCLRLSGPDKCTQCRNGCVCVVRKDQERRFNCIEYVVRDVSTSAALGGATATDADRHAIFKAAMRKRFNTWLERVKMAKAKAASKKEKKTCTN